MDSNRQSVWAQWDKQETRRIELQMQENAYITLNNLYLSIERGETKLTVATGNQLRILATKAYNRGDSMVDWWAKEFQELKGWDNV